MPETKETVAAVETAVKVDATDTAKAAKTPEELAALAETARKEQEAREAADKLFLEEQYGRLKAIGEAYARWQDNAKKDIHAFSASIACYVDNDLRHASEKERGRTFIVSNRRIEEFLSEYTDDVKAIGISRLLGIYGLSSLIPAETLEKVSISLLKVGVMLTDRVIDADGLDYAWKSQVTAESAEAFFAELAKGTLTVKAAIEARDKLLNPAAESSEEAETDTGETGTKSPVEKASARIASALGKLGKDAEGRASTVKRLVKTAAFGPVDILSAMEALTTKELKRVVAGGRLLLEQRKEREASEKAAAEKLAVAVPA